MAKIAVRGAIVLSILAAGACAPAPVPPPAGSATAQTPVVSAAAAPHAEGDGASSFSVLRDRIFDELLADEPGDARSAGMHEYDGKIGTYSAEGIAARMERLRKARASLAAADRAALSADEGLDLALLGRQVEMALFYLADVERWRHFPQHYEELFSVNVYLDRDYAPIAERAAKLVEHEEAALAQVGNIRKNLMSPMSKPVVETAARNYAGFAEYLRRDVVRALTGVGDAKFQERFARANTALADEAEKLARHLKTVELPKGDASHALGPVRYARLLAAQEGLSISIADFKKMGEDNLRTNRAALDVLRKEHKAPAVRPRPADLLAKASNVVDSSRAFVVQKNLVTIPSADRARVPVVKETPPYARWNGASLDSPGALEKATNLEAFYYITLPDSSWSKKDQEEYVMTVGHLQATTVHEVFPGHFLHSLWMRRAPTRVQKLVWSYSFGEGWAHYVEQMMLDEGFGGGGPELRIGQLEAALVRNCRFVASVGMHAEGMSLEQAEKRLVDDCAMTKVAAHEQAVRGTFDPGYFAYTLGKLQILALRDEAKKKLGPKFTMQKFHDALLAHGAPPVALIRDRVLKDMEEAP